MEQKNHPKFGRCFVFIPQLNGEGRGFSGILIVVGSIGYPLHICSSFHVHVFWAMFGHPQPNYETYQCLITLPDPLIETIFLSYAGQPCTENW